MTSRGLAGRRKRSTGTVPRVGLFGLLGSGNLGNDRSLEAVLAFRRTNYPDAILGCLCAGPEQVTARYGIPATPCTGTTRKSECRTGVLPAMSVGRRGNGAMRAPSAAPVLRPRCQ